MNELRAIIGIVALVLIAGSVPSHGCSGETPSIPEVSELADYIIAGVVTDREMHRAGEGISYDDSTVLHLPSNVVKFTVRVSQVWKGKAEHTAFVFDGISSCSYKFIVGESYLIYGWHEELTPEWYATTSPGVDAPVLRFAGKFYRIKPMRYAREELEYLGEPIVDYRAIEQSE